METPQHPCKVCLKVRFEKRDYHKEPCASCDLPRQYDDQLKQGFFPITAFMRDSSQFTKIKENKEAKKRREMEKKILTDPIETRIEEVCKEQGLTVEQLRAGIQGYKDPTVTQKYHVARDKIIIELSSGKYGDFTQPQIGQYINMSFAMVSRLMKRLEIDPIGRRWRTQKQKDEMEGIKELVFEDDNAMYERVLHASEYEERSIAAQIRWIVKQHFEWLEACEE